MNTQDIINCWENGVEPYTPWQQRTRRVLAQQMLEDVKYSIHLLNKPPVDVDWTTRLDDNNLEFPVK